MFEFLVPGKIRGKARPRIFYNKNMGRMQAINTKETVSYENWIKVCFLQNYPIYRMLETPLRLEMTGYFVKAKSNKMKYPTIKPDCDNIIKCIDALNGVAFKDDKQIIEVEFKKVWASEEALKIKIYEL